MDFIYMHVLINNKLKQNKALFVSLRHGNPKKNRSHNKEISQTETL